ncbi:hypothetical protein [Vibrio atypicus]|uniref:hypothetical protein n=1 Tax=Vibrio atypicus TaxID=558271 RepID=UPI00135B8B20|nr:hypothetical protein [Vibrio atypicus]
MRKLLIIALTSLFAIPAYADVTIPKNRVTCETKGAMQSFLKRKTINAVKKDLPKGCETTELKRRGEIVDTFPKQGFLEVKLKTGNKVYVDRDAVKRS